MEIIYTNKAENVSTFKYVNALTVFDYEGDYYFKTRDCFDENYQVISNAVDLYTGAPSLFDADDKVNIHQATLTIDGVSPC